MKKNLIIILAIVLFTGCINKLTRRSVSESEYKGVISRMYIDNADRGSAIFEIKSTIGLIEENADLWVGAWEYAKVGDSIIKLKGRLDITIKRENSRGKFVYRW